MLAKKINILIVIITSLIFTSGCLKEIDSSAELTVILSLPENIDQEIDLTSINIKLQDKGSSYSKTVNPDRNGVATFQVLPGKYDIIASSYDEASRIAINGACSEFLLSEKGIVSDGGEFVTPEITILLEVAIPSPLVIREIYYHGSSTLNGANYTNDRYIEIYNNTGPEGKSVYLDSLCIGTIAPPNSTTASNPWEGEDTIAIFQMFWMFPGNGTDHPLAPGESCVVALQAAVDHSARATSGLHLERAHFGCYDDILTKHEIAAGVPRMVCYMGGQGYAWGVSVHSPAFVLFKPEMGVTAYRANAKLWERHEPGKTSGLKYWHISKTWIIDGVECVDTPKGAIKRLPSSIDAAYTYMSSSRYSGKCVTRKLLGTFDGIKVYQDTNNSLEDFIPDAPLSPNLK